MERLDQADLQAMLEALRRVYALRDLDAFPAAVLKVLQDLVPGRRYEYVEVNLRTNRVVIVAEPPEVATPAMVGVLGQQLGERRLPGAYRQSRDEPTSEIAVLMSRRQFRDGGLDWDAVYCPDGVEDQLGIVLPTPSPLIIGVGIHRDEGGFSERDRVLLDALRPHLAQAYRNAEALTLLERGLSAGGQAVVVLGADGRVQLAGGLALRWLAEYFDEPFEPTTGLPESLHHWGQRQRGLLQSAVHPPPALEPLVCERDGKRLTIRWAPSGRPSEQSVLLLDEQAESTAEALATLGLTRREAEVLHWVARGKTDPEIAEILTVSRRTVEKHLEHIFAKLGVQTRTAAAAQAFQAPRPA